MSLAALIYPHQLFADHPALIGTARAVMIEEPLLFTQFRFHRQKLILHRAAMKRYARRLESRGVVVDYLEARELPETGSIGDALRRLEIGSVRYVDPCDDWLGTRLAASLARHRITATVLEDRHFLTDPAVLRDFAADKKKLFFTEFYIAQRKRLGMLLGDDGRPVGGRWSFDPINRKRLPKGIRVPPVVPPREDASVAEARRYVRARFPEAIGSDAGFGYPTDHLGAEAWLATFVRHRLAAFGDYEDAISPSHDVLFHSVLTPLLNIGLISPRQVIDAALAESKRLPLNSLEGFIRQVVGWREFVRLVYRRRGRAQRTRNFWGFTHAIPAAFYDGTTGVEPVDQVIRKALRTGYCHHIERLMILGNFMLLCEISPDAVYRWFMELFVDSYDWVMVPNVYGMSQFADGGLMTTKPYLSGSSYVLKMSDFAKGPWCAVWDALYWRFIDRHADVLAKNPRMAIMVKMRHRLGKRLKDHLRVADSFLARLHG
ncbi:MAG: cryptochrome/photolyase family protein [Gemmatimonadetes bacterium]|nr:cryptochrome/photolyase family protein [Gemmatimonadota bacterium]